MKKTFALIVFNCLIIGLFGQAEQHQLDSIVHLYEQLEGFSKTEFTYDGNNTLAISYRSDVLGQWKNDRQEEYAYDIAGNEILTTTHSWDIMSQQWIGDTKNERTYDSNGNQTLHIRYYWDENTQQWRNSRKYERNYDTNGHEILYISYKWNSTVNNWIGELKTENIYTDGQFTEHVKYKWDTDAGQWIGYKKEEYTYNAEGNLAVNIDYNWNTDTQVWENYYKTETLYTDGSISSTMSYEWIANQWINHLMYEYKYNVEGQLIKATFHWLSDGVWSMTGMSEYDYDNAGNQILVANYNDWNVVTEQWGSANKKEYTFDNNDNRTSRTKFDWNADTQQWQPTERSNSVYGEFVVDELIIPEFMHNIYTQLNISNNQAYGESYEWDETNQTWALTYRSDYHYTSVITAVENVKANYLRIFPNPTSDLVNFDLENPTSATITIHDVQGKYIGTQHLQNQQLSLRHLNSGIYFYRLLHDGEMYRGKFIVK